MRKSVVFAVILILFLLVLVGFYRSWPKPDDRAGSKKTAESLPITFYAYECSPGRTVYDLLEQQPSAVETQDYSFGKLVTAIGGVRNGPGGKNWIYYVDAQVASVSADNYECLGRERVEWKFEPSPY